MALTYSKMLPLTTKLPSFNLPNVITGDKFSSNNLSMECGKVIMFICNHCPYVIHYHDQLVRLINEYVKKNIEFVAISSNDVENYPQDSPENMKILFKDLSLSIPYLYDESQEIAKKYMAECTPEFYFFDKNNSLIYRGRMDESSPRNGIKPSGEDLRSAIDNFILENEIDHNQLPSMGCNIKWK